MTKRLAGFLLALVAVFALVPGFASADSKPYFKVFGGDVFAGGWVNNGATACSTSDSNYQAPTFNPTTNQYAGGIYAFAKSSRLGASTDFGAYAMGLIEGNSSSQFGFYDGSSGSNTLSFSNNNANAVSNYWGGFFAGNTQQTHCIPDYYDTKQDSPTNLGTAASINLGSYTNGTHNHQYIVSPAGASVDITSSAASVSAGAEVTLFVNGNAYISHNIAYASYNATNVPKLAIVVKGEIYIAPSVTQIDGLLVAQPDLTSSTTIADTGDLWTCHDSTNSTPAGDWIGSNCGGKLTINGAVIAKQVNFLRVNGDLASATANEAASSGNIAEVINYIPAMVIGDGFFNQPPQSGATIDSLVSLPPVF